jgi:hypothetical protein
MFKRKTKEKKTQEDKKHEQFLKKIKLLHAYSYDDIWKNKGLLKIVFECLKKQNEDYLFLVPTTYNPQSARIYNCEHELYMVEVYAKTYLDSFTSNGNRMIAYQLYGYKFISTETFLEHIEESYIQVIPDFMVIE